MAHPLSVLIVDDESSIRNLLAHLVTALGYRVAGIGCNGAEAIEMTRTLQPDLLIIDIKMPIMNGLEAAERILTEREIPIIVCSGAATPENRSRAAQIGIQAFLSKPFLLDGLRDALRLAGVAEAFSAVSA